MNSNPDRHDRESEQQRRPPKKSAILRIFRAGKRQFHRYKRYKQKQGTEHKINERMMAQWTRRLGYFTLILVIIAGVTGYILWQTDQTYRSGQRAYIGASINLIPVRDANNKIDFWRIKVLLENSGNTDARNTHWQITADVDYLPDPEKTDVSPNFIDQGTMALPPKEIAPILDSATTRRQLATIIKGRGIFYIGRITYVDIYDVEHLTKFCLHVYGGPYSPQMPPEVIDTLIDQFDLAYGYCRRNNCTDKDCKSQ